MNLHRSKAATPVLGPILSAALAITLLTILPNVHAENAPFPGKDSFWNRFVMSKDGGKTVVVPTKAATGKPWIWRARFWGQQRQFDIALLKKGYHLVYCNVGGLYGSPKAVDCRNAFYKTLHENHGFAKKVVLDSMNCGCMSEPGNLSFA